MVQTRLNGSGGQKTFCYLSELLGKKIYGKEHQLLGKVQDVVATLKERYPEIEGFVVTCKGERRFVPALSQDFIRLASGKLLELEHAQSSPYARGARQFLVRDTLYDKQILDVNGAKVERVNDVQILIYTEKPFLVHVDVGFTGLSRRLGFEGGMRSLARLVGHPLKDELIGWKFVQPLPETAVGPVQVTLRQEQIKELHAGELADIIEELDRDERLALVKAMGAEEAAEALEEADIAVQTSILRDLDTAFAADILEEMEPAVAADVMEELPEETQQSIMAAMEDEQRAQLELLAQAEEETAASLMTVDFITCVQSDRVAQAWQTLRQEAGEIESITYIYCSDGQGALVGVVSLRDLILAQPEQTLAEIMRQRLATLQRDDDWEEVAEAFFKYRFKALPVIDAQGKMEGLVTFRHSFEELLSIYSRLAA